MGVDSGEKAWMMTVFGTTEGAPARHSNGTVSKLEVTKWQGHGRVQRNGIATDGSLLVAGAQGIDEFAQGAEAVGGKASGALL